MRIHLRIRGRKNEVGEQNLRGSGQRSRKRELGKQGVVANSCGQSQPLSRVGLIPKGLKIKQGPWAEAIGFGASETTEDLLKRPF